MAAIFDHLTAIIVGASLLAVLVFVQQRSQQANVEATIQHATQEQAATVMEMLERDTDNMRVLETFVPEIRASGGLTTNLTFHTLADPNDGAGSDVVAVQYRLEDTFETIHVDGRTRNVYRLARYVNDGVDDDGDGFLYDYAGGSTEGVLDFRAALLSQDGLTRVVNGTAPEDFSRISIDLVSGIEGPAQRAADQATTVSTNLSQQGATFRPISLRATTFTSPNPVPDASAALPSSPFSH